MLQTVLFQVKGTVLLCGKWSEPLGSLCVRATQTSFPTVTITSGCSSAETCQAAHLSEHQDRPFAFSQTQVPLDVPLFQNTVTRAWENQDNTESQSLQNTERKKKAFRCPGFSWVFQNLLGRPNVLRSVQAKSKGRKLSGFTTLHQTSCRAETNSSAS